MAGVPGTPGKPGEKVIDANHSNMVNDVFKLANTEPRCLELSVQHFNQAPKMAQYHKPMQKLYCVITGH